MGKEKVDPSNGNSKPTQHVISLSDESEKREKRKKTEKMTDAYGSCLYSVVEAIYISPFSLTLSIIALSVIAIRYPVQWRRHLSFSRLSLRYPSLLYCFRKPTRGQHSPAEMSFCICHSAGRRCRYTTA